MNTGGHINAPLSALGRDATASGRADQSPWLFLSLYLMLFAFFIVLNSYSSIDSTRRDAVVSSVIEAFARVSGPQEGRQLRVALGREGQAQQFQDDVTEVFRTIVPLQQIKVIQSGTRLDVDVPAPAFFDGQSVNVRSTLPMLDRIVATVSSPPDNIRYELVILGQVESAAEQGITAAMTAELARVGNIARTLVARGMPPNTVSIGLEHGDAQFIRFVFLAVDQETTSGFSLLPGSDAQ